ncbi:MAG: family 5 extracellular solute-binding protein peptide/nickel transport system substrate-binding [Parcubacteria group bacterium]|nr:family 5 extracellular solute-binding protein peptide/nickel transport system substrate-binding [Parcubacteria group bacterium]
MTYSSLRALLVKRFSLPKERPIKKAIRSFSPAEKSVFYILVGLFIFAAIAMLWKVNNSFLIETPARGGTLTEGVVGNPRFINPVLAISEPDKTLTSLIYSGLVRTDKTGAIQNDLADNVSISDDGLTYTVHIRPSAIFSDGSAVTADDVLFTIQKILDPNLKSPLLGDWSGITAQKVDDQTVNFILKKPYAPFIDNLTVGILPKHIWKNVTTDEFAFSQFNTLPVGTGPFMVGSVTRNSGGIPDYYDLVPFDKAIGGEPYIGHYIFRFYPSERDLLAAYDGGDIDAMSGISSDEAKSLKNAANILSSPLPRIFGVFFNQSQNPALLQKEVRQALDLAAPKEDIVKSVLGGYGTPIDSPLPPSLFPWTLTENPKSSDERLAEAQALLAKNGWVKNSTTGVLEKKSKKDTITLSFSISTGNAPELTKVADELRDAWTKLGASVDVQVYETGDLNQNIIRPRKYDALLFGEVVGRDADVYPFWHSSQRIDPGLNIALYANSKVDKLLEDARRQSDPAKRDADYKSFDQEIRNDVPAVFLYAPNYIDVVPKSLLAVSIGNLSVPSDRFTSVRDWYIDTDNVWQIFVK